MSESNVTRNGGRTVHAGRLNHNGGNVIQACQAYADDTSWVPTDATATCKSCRKIVGAERDAT